VLSTYSNLDNNPVTIDGGRRRGKKKKKQISAQPVVEEEEEEEQVQIRLSNKTGLPLGVLPTKEKGDDFDFDTIASVNKGEKRSKTESANQKKVRKQQIKQERQVARIQKKMMKEAFAAEFVKADGATDDMAGKTVFKF
jgi:protein LTV1